MTKCDLAKIGLFALSVLFASGLNVQGSEDDYRKDCPTAREWVSTIDPEKRSSFRLLAESSTWGHSPDGPASTGIATLDLGSGLINLVELAQQTAMSCKEKRDKRASCPVERFNGADRSRFCVPEG